MEKRVNKMLFCDQRELFIESRQFEIKKKNVHHKSIETKVSKKIK